MKVLINHTQQIEDWLAILTKTYQEHPSAGLAKTICYYIERILNQDDISDNNLTRCEYFAMKKFWLWKKEQN